MKPRLWMLICIFFLILGCENGSNIEKLPGNLTTLVTIERGISTRSNPSVSFATEKAEFYEDSMTVVMEGEFAPILVGNSLNNSSYVFYTAKANENSIQISIPDDADYYITIKDTSSGSKKNIFIPKKENKK